MRYLTVALVLCAVATNGYAEEKRWSDEAELSYVDTGGNTEVRTLSAKNLLKYKFTEKWQGSWRLGALYGESDGQTNAENYFTELRVDYLVTERSYANLIGGWNKDEFAGIKGRYYVGPGIGYKFLTGPKHFLNGEASLTYVNVDYTNNTDKDYPAGRGFGKYEYAFTEKNKFSQSLEFLYDFDDSDNYQAYSETAVTSALNGHLSLKAGYEVKYNNQPIPSTLKQTDTVLSVALVVNY